MDQLKLDKKELELVKFLRAKGVLKDVDASHIKTNKGGEIIITCGDGDQFSDIYGHRLYKTGSIRPKDHRPHMLAVNGGPLLISTLSPLQNHFLIDQIGSAIRLKNFTHIALYAHGPCAAAKEHNLSVKDMITLLIDGEKYLNLLYGGITTKRYFHVDNGEKRTYFVSIEKWNELRDEIESFYIKWYQSTSNGQH